MAEQRGDRDQDSEYLERDRDRDGERAFLVPAVPLVTFQNFVHCCHLLLLSLYGRLLCHPFQHLRGGGNRAFDVCSGVRGRNESRLEL